MARNQAVVARIVTGRSEDEQRPGALAKQAAPNYVAGFLDRKQDVRQAHH